MALLSKNGGVNLRKNTTLSCIRRALSCTLARLVGDLGLPGATAAAVLPGGDVVAVSAGLADREAGRAMQPGDRLLAASIGKSFVAAVALSLAEEGVLPLDAPVSRWLGTRAWFPHLPNGDALTMRMLLGHATGLEDFVYQPAYAAQRRAYGPDWFLPHEDKIGLVLDRPALFPAGAGFAYSDTNYILAGMAIEAASGRSYQALAEERLLRPLRLAGISASDRRRLPGLVPGYSAPDDPFAAVITPGRQMDADGSLLYNPASEWTGGGMIATAADLARWGRYLCDGSALPFAYRETLLAPSLADPLDTPWRHYGLGIMHFRSDHGEAYGHWGGMPGYSGLMACWPGHGVGLAMLANITLFDRQAAQDDLMAALIQTMAGEGGDDATLD